MFLIFVVVGISVMFSFIIFIFETVYFRLYSTTLKVYWAPFVTDNCFLFFYYQKLVICLILTLFGGKCTSRSTPPQQPPAVAISFLSTECQIEVDTWVCQPGWHISWSSSSYWQFSASTIKPSKIILNAATVEINVWLSTTPDGKLCFLVFLYTVEQLWFN